MKKPIIRTRKGDVFSVSVDETYVKYFQYVANDLTQLNSDVIRVYLPRVPLESNVDLDEIVAYPVDFYAHTSVNAGVKLDLWQKVGHYKNHDANVPIYFRDTLDYGHGPGEEPVKISENWRIWKINDERFTLIGKLTKPYQSAEIGLVFAPIRIIERIKTGSYNLKNYPSWE